MFVLMACKLSELVQSDTRHNSVIPMLLFVGMFLITTAFVNYNYCIWGGRTKKGTKN